MTNKYIIRLVTKKKKYINKIKTCHVVETKIDKTYWHGGFLILYLCEFDAQIGI